jgi:Zn-dependent protease with chaperone function
MQARFFDGLTARSWPMVVTLDEGALTFGPEDASRRWALGDLQVDAVGPDVRISRGDERLMMEAAAWRALTGEGGVAAERRSKRREHRLIAGLSAFGAGLAVIVFVGIPLASGDLARHTPPALERRIGDSLGAQLSTGFRPCGGQAGQQALARLGTRLQAAARTPFQIRIEAVRAPMMNAFALPGGKVMVTSRLIATARTPDELSAVIAHEAAHVERRHVMQALWRSFGVGIVLDLLVGGGSGGGQQLVLLAGSLTDLRYSRAAEAEADARGMELLGSMGLSSLGMASFFDRIGGAAEGPNAAMVKEVISSHPSSLKREQVARANGRPGVPAFTAQEWTEIRAACEPERPGRWFHPRQGAAGAPVGDAPGPAGA